jgi:hypothetical protein
MCRPTRAGGKCLTSGWSPRALRARLVKAMRLCSRLSRGVRLMKNKVISAPFATQVASDVIRDGLGVELLANGEVVAEVFRCDVDRSLVVNTFGNDVPLVEIERLISRARNLLEAFEDGTPLPVSSD